MVNTHPRAPRWTSMSSSLLAFTLIGGVAGSALGPATPAHAEVKKSLGADVKIEIRQPNGKVAQHRTQVDAFELPFKYTFSAHGAEHTVALTLRQDGDSKSKLFVTLGYDRDGEAIIAPFETDWTANKREIIKTDDGKYAIALTVKPKMIAVKDKQRDESDQIEPDDSDDPLGGL